jgi:hypothetical protein
LRKRHLAALVIVVLGVVLGVVFGWPWLEALSAARTAAVAEAHFKAARDAQYPPRAKSGQRPDYAKAIEEYRQAIEANPSRIDAHRGLIDATRTLQFTKSLKPAAVSRALVAVSLPGLSL